MLTIPTDIAKFMEERECKPRFLQTDGVDTCEFVTRSGIMVGRGQKPTEHESLRAAFDEAKQSPHVRTPSEIDEEHRRERARAAATDQENERLRAEIEALRRQMAGGETEAPEAATEPDTEPDTEGDPDHEAVAESLEALVAEAESLGIKVDGRWKEERLRNEIDAARRESEPAEA